MTLKFFPLVLFSIIVSQNYVLAQQQDFGDVSKTILEMEVYEKDSTADAVVLFDVGEVYVNEQLEVRFKRHVRIKVLTDKGLEAGDIAIGFREDDPEQEIKRIKAESYFLAENGKMEKEKLGRRDKFENEVSENWKEIKFTIPALKKGSVFDYSYEMISESPVDIPDWFFQNKYPTVWSEFSLSIPEWFNYLNYFRGYHNFTINDRERYNDAAIFRGGGRLDYEGTKYHYVMKDVPALSEEPFMNARVNFLAQVRFQLQSYQFPNDFRKNVLNTWPLLVEAVNDSENYGKRMKSSSLLKSKALEVTDGVEDQTEKMISLYKHVGEAMDWDETYGLFVSDDLDDIYNTGSGSGSEINLILTQMLKEAGLEAYPVILSTRGNGEIIDIYPISDQFNHTIVLVKIDGKEHLLDAKNELRPYNLLPASVLNGRGLVITEDNSVTWVSLKNDLKNKLSSLINIRIAENGNMSGSVESTNTGFPAYEYAQVLNSDEVNKDVEEHVFTGVNDITVDSTTIINQEDPGLFQYQIHFSSDLESTDEFMYLNPMLIESIDENPFTRKQRTYPIDYEYDFEKTVIMTYFLPQGWSVDEIPESKAYKLSNGKGFYRRILQATEGFITIRYDFNIGENRFQPAIYDEIKFMYENIAQDNAELIVLKKDAE